MTTDSLQRSDNKKNKGFTLMEVLIALFLFSVSILGLGALQLNSLKSVTRASVITRATALAHSQIELLKGLSMTDTKVSGDSEIIQQGSFWIQRLVTDDFPIGKRSVDTGSGLADTTVCKTIEIQVFEDSGGKKLLASSSFVKSYTAVE